MAWKRVKTEADGMGKKFKCPNGHKFTLKSGAIVSLRSSTQLCDTDYWWVAKCPKCGAVTTVKEEPSLYNRNRTVWKNIS